MSVINHWNYNHLMSHKQAELTMIVLLRQRSLHLINAMQCYPVSVNLLEVTEQ